MQRFYSVVASFIIMAMAVTSCVAQTPTFKDGIKTVKIVVEQVPNRQIREFHVNASMSTYKLGMFGRPLNTSGDDYKRIGKVGQELTKSLFSIGGVTMVMLTPYNVDVEIGRAFDWNTIEPKVISVIRDVILTGKATIKSAAGLPTTEGKVAVVVERFQNTRIQCFHLKQVISNSTIERFKRPIDSESRDDLQSIGMLGSTLVKRLMLIEGVTEIYIKPYSVEVELAYNFNWSNVEAEMLRIIRFTVAEANRNKIRTPTSHKSI